MHVDDLEKDRDDSAGARVVDVYAKRPPVYAVYRTAERVLIHFADDEKTESEQRTAMAQLNPLRGEINGLIDGWRASTRPKLISRVKRYDRRVADALGLGLEHEVDAAKALLAEIKKDIIDRRTSWARLLYLGAAFGAVAFVIVVVAVVSCLVTGGCVATIRDASWNLWFAAGTGAVGAFFSIAIGIRNRTVLMDLHWVDNASDAVLRIVIGIIAGTVLVCLVQSKAISLQIGEVNLGMETSAQPEPGAAANTATGTGAATQIPVWLGVLLVAFVGGFSERLVPDLLGKVSGESSNVPQAESSVPPPPAPSRSSQAPGNAKDQSDDEDSCLSEHTIPPDAMTRDSELPPASGGVAPP